MYRRAGVDELPGMARFCADAYAGDIAYFERRWEHDPAPDSFNAVLEERGTVVAHLRVFARQVFVRRNAPHPCAAIGNVAVAQAQRGRRLSTPLLQATLDDCRASGFTVSLLHTHAPAVYQAVGYRRLPVREVRVRGAPSGPWTEIAIDPPLRELYEHDHGGRPGTVARTAAWWEARERWLGPEGWRAMSLAGVDGYCYLRDTLGGGEIDEAVGECADLVRGAAPGGGCWRMRRPRGVNEAPPAPEDGGRMGLAIDPRIDLSPLTGSGAVSWRTDEF